MKHYFVFFCTFCLVVNTIFAQTATESENKSETQTETTTPQSSKTDTIVTVIQKDGDTKINVRLDHIQSDTTKIIRKNKEELEKLETRWMIFDLGKAGYLEDGSFNLSEANAPFKLRYGRSWNVNIHVVRQRLSLIKNYVNLEYGLGLAFNSYNFDSDITLVPGEVQLSTTETGADYKKNKLKTTAIHAPLMLHFETNPRKYRKSFRLSAGVYGELLTWAKTKQVSSEEGKRKFRDDFHLNRVRYGLVGQVGIGPINFYASYSLKELFKENEGPAVNPFNVGITIVPF